MARPAVKKPADATKITTASAKSAFEDWLSRFLIAIPMPPPITTQIVPPVTANAFAAINSSFFTSKGNPAESPDKINRLTPNANKTNNVRINPVELLLINQAIINKLAALR